MNDRDGATAEAQGSAEVQAGDPAEVRRLEILRQLERGEIGVAEAGDRLGELDEVLR